MQPPAALEQQQASIAGAPHLQPVRLVEAADRALYVAKAAGRNRAAEISLEIQPIPAPNVEAALPPLRPA